MQGAEKAATLEDVCGKEIRSSESELTSFAIRFVDGTGLLMTAVAGEQANSQQAASPVPNPGNQNLFQLNDLPSYRMFSQVKNFEIVGHSYFRGPWLVPGAPGAGVNTLRICGNVAYLAGYNPSVFGATSSKIDAIPQPKAARPTG